MIGECLWDILSDNHELRLPDGRIVYLSSMRGTASSIAQFSGDSNDWAYMTYYMGTSAIADKGVLAPIYRYIFRRLQACGLDWIYRTASGNGEDLPRCVRQMAGRLAALGTKLALDHLSAFLASADNREILDR